MKWPASWHSKQLFLRSKILCWTMTKDSLSFFLSPKLLKEVCKPIFIFHVIQLFILQIGKLREKLKHISVLSYHFTLRVYFSHVFFFLINQLFLQLKTISYPSQATTALDAVTQCALVPELYPSNTKGEMTNSRSVIFPLASGIP